ncbi:hypothetical protein [Streptomyces sp. NPDC088847]|uniref:hypothetical protein n=1 Tax=Streptomyces sp. NPDC088847 TaxID=3365909 RepID=UPI00382E3EF7
MSTTTKDVIRVATRAYTKPHGSVTGTRTYVHVNCDCKIASTLMGTYDNLAEANRKAAKLVDAGDTYKRCSKSGPVKAVAAARPVWHFENTPQAASSTINGTGVRDGDVVVVEAEGVVAVVINTAVTPITVERGHLQDLYTSVREFRRGRYAEAADRAEAEARRIGATVDPLHAASPAAEEAPVEDATPADVVRTDGVQVKADGRGKWNVIHGGDFLGTVFDEGPQMKRGRFAGWSPYAGTPGNVTAFSHDPAEAVESVVQAWPVTVAELVAETGFPLDVVLAATDTVREMWDAEGRRGVLKIAAATGAATKVTREAAEAIREVLTSRPARYAVPIGADDRTFPRFHDRDAAVRCAATYGMPESTVLDADAPAELPAPEWGTLKGRTAPFRLWGTERDGRFCPAFDRKQVTGEPLVIAEVWTEQRGTARLGRDESGREIHLYGAATRFWSAAGA